MFKRICNFIIYFLKKAKQFIIGYYGYLVDLFRYQRNNTTYRFKLKIAEILPCVYDKTALTGFEPHYIYHPAWAARILSKTKPKFHVDISSTLNFCSIVSAFIPIKFYDYRPANLVLSGLKSGSADLLKLHLKSNSIKSLSCMHTLEHIGLGRYGDEIDIDGDIKAIKELKRVVAIGGNLLVVVPVGQKKLVFNAHRIYSSKEFKSYFSDMKLIEFSLVPDDYENGLVLNPSDSFCDNQKYACGCFWFKKFI